MDSGTELVAFVMGLIVAASVASLGWAVHLQNFEESVVEKTQACYVLNEDHIREFKWECDDEQ